VLKTLGFAAACLARAHSSRAAIAAYQLRQLNDVLRHAVQRVPYYGELFAAHGLRAEEIQSVGDLARVPITGKRELRALAPEALIARGVDRTRLIEHKTSGSTGIPTRIWRTATEERRLNLQRWRALWLLGLRPRDRVAIVKTIWDAPPPSFDRLQTLSRRLGLLDRRIVDCFQPPAALLAQLRAFRPHVVAGYPGVLVGIARAIATEGRDDWTPRMVLTGGESLLHPHRALVRDRFGAPVYDIYGTTECNVAAWECPHTGEYHTCDDSVIVEICRDGVPVAPGETGEVVITSLHSRAMPLIRVALGDEAVAGSPQCACGLPFSTLREVRGRVIDFLPLPEGRRLHPFELLNVVVDTAGHWIAEYQITQLAPDRFVMELVGSRAVGPDDLAALLTAMVELLGTNVRFDIEQVSDIARDRSGKLHFCRSLVA